jgi:hypothetical protein
MPNCNHADALASVPSIAAANDNRARTVDEVRARRAATTARLESERLALVPSFAEAARRQFAVSTPANDNAVDWPLKKLLMRDRLPDLLTAAEHYRRIHDLAHLPPPLGTMTLVSEDEDDETEGENARLDRVSTEIDPITETTTLTDVLASYGPKSGEYKPGKLRRSKAATAMCDEGGKAVNASVDPELSVTSPKRFKPIKKAWQGEWRLIATIDAKDELARLRGYLEDVGILESFEAAVVDDWTIEAIGREYSDYGNRAQQQAGAVTMIKIGLDIVFRKMNRGL